MSLANQTRSWVILVAVLLVVSAAKSQPPEANKLYEEVFYPSRKLRIQAYFYKPEGKGPFPVVIYNHGSRAGRERVPDALPLYREDAYGERLRRAGSRAARLRPLGWPFV